MNTKKLQVNSTKNVRKSTKDWRNSLIFLSNRLKKFYIYFKMSSNCLICLSAGKRLRRQNCYFFGL
ncbi:hypothetical protein B5E53_02535 [Eubacterium sp. An11]|nr:hypothetical protein B5E53_02535 [Eubacterium sp. An11]